MWVRICTHGEARSQPCVVFLKSSHLLLETRSFIGLELISWLVSTLLVSACLPRLSIGRSCKCAPTTMPWFFFPPRVLGIKLRSSQVQGNSFLTTVSSVPVPFLKRPDLSGRDPGHLQSSVLKLHPLPLFYLSFCMLNRKLHFTVKVTAFFLWGLQGKQPFVSICEHTCSLCLGRVLSAFEVIIFL